MGYYWGGDGETTLRVDTEGLQGSLAMLGMHADRTVIMPINAYLDVHWHTPKNTHRRQSMILTIAGGSIRVIAGFRQIPVFQSIISMVQRGLAEMQVNSAVLRTVN